MELPLAVSEVAPSALSSPLPVSTTAARLTRGFATRRGLSAAPSLFPGARGVRTRRAGALASRAEVFASPAAALLFSRDRSVAASCCEVVSIESLKDFPVEWLKAPESGRRLGRPEFCIREATHCTSFSESGSSPPAGIVLIQAIARMSIGIYASCSRKLNQEGCEGKRRSFKRRRARSHLSEQYASQEQKRR